MGSGGGGQTAMTVTWVILAVLAVGGFAAFWGRPYAELGPRRHEVGAVLEASGFHPGRTVRDHLRVRCAASGLPASRVEAVLEATGMSALEARRARWDPGDQSILAHLAVRSALVPL